MGCTSSHAATGKYIVKKENLEALIKKILDIKGKFPDNCAA
jgi:hypothetical protein